MNKVADKLEKDRERMKKAQYKNRLLNLYREDSEDDVFKVNKINIKNDPTIKRLEKLAELIKDKSPRS